PCPHSQRGALRKHGAAARVVRPDIGARHRVPAEALLLCALEAVAGEGVDRHLAERRALLEAALVERARALGELARLEEASDEVVLERLVGGRREGVEALDGAQVELRAVVERLREDAREERQETLLVRRVRGAVRGVRDRLAARLLRGLQDRFVEAPERLVDRLVEAAERVEEELRLVVDEPELRGRLDRR